MDLIPVNSIVRSRCHFPLMYRDLCGSALVYRQSREAITIQFPLTSYFEESFVRIVAYCFYLCVNSCAPVHEVVKVFFVQFVKKIIN